MQAMEAVEARLEDVIFPQPPDGSHRRRCPKCGDNTLALRVSKQRGSPSGGSFVFVSCKNYRSEQKCTFRRHMRPEDGMFEASDEGIILGVLEETGEDVRVVKGRNNWCVWDLVACAALTCTIRACPVTCPCYALIVATC